jgi:hypothetical protein
MNESIHRVGEKVLAIFTELVGVRANRLDGSKIAEPAMSAITAACTQEYGAKAHDLGFHMADWNSDAAFIVAVHLFPERFTFRGNCGRHRVVLDSCTEPHSRSMCNNRTF